MKNRPSRFLSFIENAVGLALAVVGLVFFIALMHWLPDQAQLAASIVRSNP